MALGTGHFSTTDLDEMIPEVWSGRVNDFYRADLKAATFFEDWSEDFLDGGDIAHTVNLTEMSANAKTVGSEVTLSSPTETAVDLTINKHNEVSFIIEDAVASKVKKSYRAQETYMTNAGYTVAATLEDEIIGLFSGFSNTVGDSTAALTDANIRKAISYLTDVPDKDRAFFLHQEVIWNQVMGIDKFTLVQNTGGADPVLQGQVGTLYGYPVIATSRLGVTTGHQEGAYAHKSAIAFATANIAGGQTPSTVRLQADYFQNYLGTLVTADIMFGVIENRDGSGVLIKASS